MRLGWRGYSSKEVEIKEYIGWVLGLFKFFVFVGFELLF